MKRLLSGALLLAATFVAAQQTTPPSNPPPVVTPDQQIPEQKGKQMPPDVVPQQTPGAPMATTDVQKQLQNKLDTEPGLQAAHVNAVVDDNNVTLAGTVATEEEHQLALRIANSYAGARKVVDNIKVQGTT